MSPNPVDVLESYLRRLAMERGLWPGIWPGNPGFLELDDSSIRLAREMLEELVDPDDLGYQDE